jgi:cytochrome c-type protein NapC
MKDESKKGFWSRLWQPSNKRWMLGLPIGALLALVVGVVGVMGFNTGMHYTNSNDFCYSCHIGMDTIVEEYQQSIHFKNQKGVQADCADCHVPKEFFPKMWVKIKATKDIYHMLAGTITLENFESKRNHLADAAWAQFKARDSQECKTCHKADTWDTNLQPLRAKLKHNPDLWVREDKTCVDCHQGIAHNRPVVR